MTLAVSSPRKAKSNDNRRTLFLFILPLLFASCIGIMRWGHSRPAFSAKVLSEIAQKALAEQAAQVKADSAHHLTPTQTLNATVTHIRSELARRYPDHIDTSHDVWVTNLAGGFKTSMLIMHASLTEYVMIWGSQAATTGHSGRNVATFDDWLLSGRGRWWPEGGLEHRDEHPGDHIHTTFLSGGIVQLDAGTFMLEYCHGYIPMLLPFGLGDALFSSMDAVTLARSLYAYGRLALKELFLNGKV